MCTIDKIIYNCRRIEDGVRFTDVVISDIWEDSCRQGGTPFVKTLRAWRRFFTYGLQLAKRAPEFRAGDQLIEHHRWLYLKVLRRYKKKPHSCAYFFYEFHRLLIRYTAPLTFTTYHFIARYCRQNFIHVSIDKEFWGSREMLLWIPEKRTTSHHHHYLCE